MKIIKFRNTDNPEKLEIDVIPDSAIQKSGKPFFVPDFASRFQFSAAAAVHVCRSGKTSRNGLQTDTTRRLGYALCLRQKTCSNLSMPTANRERWQRHLTLRISLAR